MVMMMMMMTMMTRTMIVITLTMASLMISRIILMMVTTMMIIITIILSKSQRCLTITSDRVYKVPMMIMKIGVFNIAIGHIDSSNSTVQLT